ncbi:MAG: TlpA family protein disulfide reductase [Proteobacteria bacterium]|nr:TlpA family protein disulfide reductase [Pseudomonadota bacterium]
MQTLTRRAVLAGGTLAAGLVPRKPRAAEPAGLPDLHVLAPPKPLPPLRFRDAAGRVHTLAEYRGRGVVLNLWATWCAPCVAELPSLDRAAAALRGSRIAVLALSSDLGGAKVVQRFYATHHITALPVLLDPDGAVLEALHVRGVPTTYLVTPTGAEAGWIEGGQDWDAPASLARVKALIGG